MKKRAQPIRFRAGVSLIEVQVAFVLFGIALSGLLPVGVMYLKQVKKLEQRLSEDATYLLAPSKDPWARKLGAAASLVQTLPAGESAAAAAPTNDVFIMSVDIPYAGDTATVEVTVAPKNP